jgi:hypothetical protein
MLGVGAALLRQPAQVRDMFGVGDYAASNGDAFALGTIWLGHLAQGEKSA